MKKEFALRRAKSACGASLLPLLLVPRVCGSGPKRRCDCGATSAQMGEMASAAR